MFANSAIAVGPLRETISVSVRASQTSTILDVVSTDVDQAHVSTSLPTTSVGDFVRGE